MKNKKLKVSLAVIILFTIGMAAMANRERIVKLFESPPPNNASLVSDKNDPAQQEIIKELVKLMERFDKGQSSLYMKTLFTAVDKLDTVNALRNIDYTLYKSDDEVYFRFGDAEAVNTKDLYVYIDHSLKRIFVSNAKKVIEPPGPISPAMILNMIQDEGYVVSKSSLGRNAAISLLNETHVSCKEYVVRYDTINKNINKIFIRLPDVNNPLDKEREKWTSMDILVYDDKTKRDDLLQINRFIRHTPQGWKPVKSLSQYELVQL